MQEKGSGHQIQALISEILTKKLGTHPPLGQPCHTREGWVLLLQSVQGTSEQWQLPCVSLKAEGGRCVPQ